MKKLFEVTLLSALIAGCGGSSGGSGSPVDSSWTLVETTIVDGKTLKKYEPSNPDSIGEHDFDSMAALDVTSAHFLNTLESSGYVASQIVAGEYDHNDNHEVNIEYGEDENIYSYEAEVVDHGQPYTNNLVLNFNAFGTSVDTLLFTRMTMGGASTTVVCEPSIESPSLLNCLKNGSDYVYDATSIINMHSNSSKTMMTTDWATLFAVDSDVVGILPIVPVEEFPIVEAPIEEFPIVEAPIEEFPIVEAPIEEFPIVEAPIEEFPIVEAPIEEFPIVEAPIEDLPVFCNWKLSEPTNTYQYIAEYYCNEELYLSSDGLKHQPFVPKSFSRMLVSWEVISGEHSKKSIEFQRHISSAYDADESLTFTYDYSPNPQHFTNELKLSRVDSYGENKIEVSVIFHHEPNSFSLRVSTFDGLSCNYYGASEAENDTYSCGSNGMVLRPEKLDYLVGKLRSRDQLFLRSDFTNLAVESWMESLTVN